jgi:hypothetical protein
MCNIYDHPLFDISFKIPSPIDTPNENEVKFEILREYEGIVYDITRELYVFALSELFHSKRTDKNFSITKNHELSKNGVCHLYVYFMPDTDIEEPWVLYDILYELIRDAYELLVIENYLNDVRYVSKQNCMKMTLLSDLSKAKCKIEAPLHVVKLAVKLDKFLQKLHKMSNCDNEQLTDSVKEDAIASNAINIHISGNNLYLPTFLMNTKSYDVHGEPERLHVHISNADQAKIRARFNIQIVGATTKYSLTNVAESNFDLISRLAKYNDEAVVEVCRTIRIIRGVQNELLEFKLLKVIYYLDKNGKWMKPS